MRSQPLRLSTVAALSIVMVMLSPAKHLDLAEARFPSDCLRAGFGRRAPSEQVGENAAAF